MRVVSYDPVADAMYIRLYPTKKSTRTKELGEQVLVDYAGKELIGIEVLDVSKKLKQKQSYENRKTPRVSLKNHPLMKMAGIAKSPTGDVASGIDEIYIQD